MLKRRLFARYCDIELHYVNPNLFRNQAARVVCMTYTSHLPFTSNWLNMIAKLINAKLTSRYATSLRLQGVVDLTSCWCASNFWRVGDRWNRWKIGKRYEEPSGGSNSKLFCYIQNHEVDIPFQLLNNMVVTFSKPILNLEQYIHRFRVITKRWSDINR